MAGHRWVDVKFTKASCESYVFFVREFFVSKNDLMVKSSLANFFNNSITKLISKIDALNFRPDSWGHGANRDRGHTLRLGLC